MAILFFDTETTGKAQHGMPSHHKGQPLPCQIGAVLCADDGTELTAVNYLVDTTPFKPIEMGAQNVHHHSNEQVRAYGVTMQTALHFFDDLVCAADRIVAHNMDFDKLVMRAAYYQLAKSGEASWGVDDDPFQDKDLFCTMKAATPVLRIPKPFKATKADPYKWPSLQECMSYFFKESIVGAHDALVDVRACARIYWSLKKMGLTDAA